MELTNSSGGFDPWRAPESTGPTPATPPNHVAPTSATSSTPDWSRFDATGTPPVADFGADVATSEVHSTDLAAELTGTPAVDVTGDPAAAGKKSKKAKKEKGGGSSKLPWVLTGLLVLGAAGLGYGWKRAHDDATKTHKLADQLTIDLAKERQTTAKLTEDLKTANAELDKTKVELEATSAELDSTKAELTTAQQLLTDVQAQLAKAPAPTSREQLVAFAQQILADYQQLPTLTPDQLKGVVGGLDARESELLSTNVGPDDLPCKQAIGIQGFTSYQLAAVSLYNLAITLSPGYPTLVSEVQAKTAEVDAALRGACGF